jgi:hypothetical protein
MLVRLESRHAVGVAWKPSTFGRYSNRRKEQCEWADMRLPRYLGMSALGKAKVLMRVESVEPEGYGDTNMVLMFLTSCDGVTPWEVVLLGIVPYRGSRGVSSRRHRSPFAKR